MHGRTQVESGLRRTALLQKKQRAHACSDVVCDVSMLMTNLQLSQMHHSELKPQRVVSQTLIDILERFYMPFCTTERP
jgi:hypothetical protein